MIGKIPQAIIFIFQLAFRPNIPLSIGLSQLCHISNSGQTLPLEYLVYLSVCDPWQRWSVCIYG